tara:strand:+ start:5164 stop:5991 length:828 start_codon:yes stop_codon:yes gene_type:complete
MSAMPWRVAAMALAGYGVFSLSLMAAQRSLVYQNGRGAPDLERSAIPDLQEVRLVTEDGLELVAWYRGAEAGKPVLVVTHGNAGHIGHRTAKLAAFTQEGYGLFLVEYRGYGGNPGKPDEDGLYADARAALDWLAAEGVTGRDLVLYGESLGTGVAVAMAAEREVGAVVLEASYSSLADVAGSLYWFVPFAGHAIFDRFDAVSRIAAIDAPLLLMHGQRDTTIPLRLAESLNDAAVEPKRMWVAPGAGHNDLYDHGAAEVVLTFLQDHLETSSNP